MLNKKGIELSLNMVVLMVIALVVLIIALILISGGSSSFSQKVKLFIADIFGGKPEEQGRCVSKEPGKFCSIYGNAETCNAHANEGCKWEPNEQSNKQTQGNKK